MSPPCRTFKKNIKKQVELYVKTGVVRNCVLSPSAGRKYDTKCLSRTNPVHLLTREEVKTTMIHVSNPAENLEKLSCVPKELTWGCCERDAYLTRHVWLTSALLQHLLLWGIKTFFWCMKHVLISTLLWVLSTQKHCPAARHASMLWKQQRGLMLKLALSGGVVFKTDMDGEGETL